jgi:polysaccharide biosynthesis protein PslJ
MSYVDNPQTVAGALEKDLDKKAPSVAGPHPFSALVGERGRATAGDEYEGTVAPHFQAWPPRSIDAATVLSIYVVLLLAIPSPMVVGPLGTAGPPSAILAVGAFFLWAWYHIQRSNRWVFGHQPVRAAALGWLLIMLIVYAHAMSLPLPADEISPADSGMLKLIGLSGVVLVANDGIRNLDRHRTVLRRLVIGVGLVAVLGLVQYATKQLFVDRIHIPGLTPGTAAWSLAERSGLTRPSGTSTHPIEYGVLLTMVLPLAITFAMKSPTRRWLYRAILGAIAFAVFLSISRSAMLCAGVALLVLAVSWTRVARFVALLISFAVAGVVYLTVPGVLGTITRLFTGASNDASVISRTDSYELAGHFISKSPLLGRGFGTFLPKYWILDNGYLGLLVEAGVLGVSGLLILIVVAAAAALKAKRKTIDDFDGELAQALLASVAAGACSLAFFDTFAFPQSAGCFFLIVGMAGALRRLTLAQARTDELTIGEVPMTPHVALTTNGGVTTQDRQRVGPVGLVREDRPVAMSHEYSVSQNEKAQGFDTK